MLSDFLEVNVSSLVVHMNIVVLKLCFVLLCFFVLFLFYFLQILARIFPSLSEAFFHQRISLDCIFISVIIEVGIELLLVILNGIDALRCISVDLTCLECARLFLVCKQGES